MPASLCQCVVTPGATRARAMERCGSSGEFDTSTMEHLKEFGTVKAIGGGNLEIYRILGKQATIAAIGGFVMGALMAYAMRPAITKIDLKLIIPPVFVAIVFAGAVVMCLAAAMISFRKVASIDPALVFRA